PDLGRLSEAMATARRGIDEAGEDTCGSAWCHRALARAKHEAGEDAEAERILRAELEILSESDLDEERVRIYALLAQVLDAQGRHDESGAAFDQARELLGRFGPDADTRRLEEILAK